MEQVIVNLQKPYANKMQTLLKILGDHLFADKFIEYHINSLKQEIANIQIDLEEFEEKYQMKSADFFQQFENGLLGDDSDFMIWSGIYEMQIKCKQNLQNLL